MILSERSLRKWRKEALRGYHPDEKDHFDRARIALLLENANNHILIMTRELLDQHLLRKEK